MFPHKVPQAENWHISKVKVTRSPYMYHCSSVQVELLIGFRNTVPDAGNMYKVQFWFTDSQGH